MSLDFNHISKDLDKEVKKELVDLYKYYDLRFRGYRKWHKKLKKRKLYLHMTSIGFTTADGIVGGVTVNPIVIGTLAGIGGVIQGYIAKTELNKKVKRTRINPNYREAQP
jgi:Pyruvate/2-oxoacid:ferredoxin oxidoreductase gamma subunit